MGSMTVVVRILCFDTNIQETRSLHCGNNRDSDRQKQRVIGKSERKVVIVRDKTVVDVKENGGIGWNSEHLRCPHPMWFFPLPGLSYWGRNNSYL